MRKDKIRAYGLRRAGKSYGEISLALGIPKSTLADWFKNEDWSKEIRDRLASSTSFSSVAKMKAIQAANRNRWATIHQSYRDKARVEFDELKGNPLFMAGLMLYWGEGDKGQGGRRVKLANADPAMIRVFYKLLRDILMVPEFKIGIWLLLYPDLEDEMQKRFWSKATGVPLSRFKKSIYIVGKNSKKRLSYGVCNIFVSSRELREKITTWLGLAQEYLLK